MLIIYLRLSPDVIDFVDIDLENDHIVNIDQMTTSLTRTPLTSLSVFFYTVYIKNQSAEGAGGLGIIRSNKVGETE